MSFMPQSGVPGYSIPGQVTMPLVDGADAPVGTVYFYPGAKDDPNYVPGQPCYQGPGPPPNCAETMGLTQQTMNSMRPQPPSYLALSIGATIICCSPIFGLIAIIFSVMSNKSYTRGDPEKARKYGMLALGFVVIAIITTVTVVIVILCFLGLLPF